MSPESTMAMFVLPFLVLLSVGLGAATLVVVLRPLVRGELELIELGGWRFPLMDLAALVVLIQVALAGTRIAAGSGFVLGQGWLALVPAILVWLAGEMLLYYTRWSGWQPRFFLLVFGLPAALALGAYNGLSVMFFVCGMLGLFVGDLRRESVGFTLLGAVLLIGGASATWLGRAASARIAQQHRPPAPRPAAGSETAT